MSVTSIKHKLSRKHEADIAEALGGVQSKSSGNQWHDQTDGRTHPYDRFSMAWDCKAAMPGTKSITITREDLAKVREQSHGQTPLMPMRWYLSERGHVEFDMVLVPAAFLAELLEIAREATDG